MNAISYGKSWFRAKRILTKVWSEEDARHAHGAKLPYAALINKSSDIRCYVEVNADYFGVGFLDALGREYLSYQFVEKEPNRLFLTMATYREFEHKLDKVNLATTYHFRESGHVTIESENYQTMEHKTKEENSDVQGNWEQYPEFGHYDALTRIER